MTRCTGGSAAAATRKNDRPHHPAPNREQRNKHVNSKGSVGTATIRPNPGGWAPELAVLRKGVFENHVLSVGVACRTGRSPKGLVRKTAPFRKEGRANRRILWRGWSRAGRETGGRRKAESRGGKREDA